MQAPLRRLRLRRIGERKTCEALSADMFSQRVQKLTAAARVLFKEDKSSGTRICSSPKLL